MSPRGCVKTVAAVLFGGVAVCALVYLVKLSTISDAKSALGEKAVHCLYSFGTLEQLDSQMSVLKSITTEDVFNQLTIDNEERALSTYLKFKGCAVSANIVKSTSSYVMYTLNSAYVSPDRHFIFMFDVDNAGRISFVREVESIDFIENFD